jgi:hypothetical protein
MHFFRPQIDFRCSFGLVPSDSLCRPPLSSEFSSSSGSSSSSSSESYSSSVARFSSRISHAGLQIVQYSNSLASDSAAPVSCWNQEKTKQLGHPEHTLAEDSSEASTGKVFPSASRSLLMRVSLFPLYGRPRTRSKEISTSFLILAYNRDAFSVSRSDSLDVRLEGGCELSTLPSLSVKERFAPAIVILKASGLDKST